MGLIQCIYGGKGRNWIYSFLVSAFFFSPFFFLFSFWHPEVGLRLRGGGIDGAMLRARTPPHPPLLPVLPQSPVVQQRRGEGGGSERVKPPLNQLRIPTQPGQRNRPQPQRGALLLLLLLFLLLLFFLLTPPPPRPIQPRSAPPLPSPPPSPPPASAARNLSCGAVRCP